MTTTVNLMGTGSSGLNAEAITGIVSLAQTATGAAQGSLTLPTDFVVYTTSTASNGPTLPATAQSGDNYIVVNNTANSINVWPPVGFKIGTAATNAALAVGAGKTCKFYALGDGNFAALLSA
jgi:hypothetical protein